MIRTIVTKKDLAAAPLRAGQGGAPPAGEAPNPYLTKVLKYIPAEVVALYVGLEAIVKSSTGAQGEGAYWFVFLVCLVATPLYLWRLGHVRKVLQLVVSTVALAVWVFALGGPFEHLAWYQAHRIVPGLLLPIFTFFVGMIDP